MRQTLALTMFVTGLSACVAAGPVIDGTAAPRFTACTGWVAKAPTAYGLTDEDGRLRFTVEGAGGEMPWIIDLRDSGLTGDERYLLVLYRAKGMSTNPGTYFLHGEEGTHGGLAYAMADDVKPDRDWHTIAVDMAAINPLETTHHLALKVRVDEGGSAWLEVAKIWFAEETPADAVLARVPAQRPARSVSLDWRTAGEVSPQAGWTRTAAKEFGATLEGDAMSFRVAGQGLGMRWLIELPEPVDLAQMRCMSVRYRATGQLGAGTYAVWLGNRAEGTGGSSAIAVAASEIKADGAWHNLSTRLNQNFAATHVAIGLDSAGPEATMALGAITFSTRPRLWTIAEALDCQPRDEAWPAGRDGFTPVPAQVSGGNTSAFLTRRLELADWFSAPNITVGGVPFEVAIDPATVAHTATAEFGTQSVALPANVTEVYLLTAAALPATEPWGLNWRRPRPVEMLDVPEKVWYEIRYLDGPADRVLPLDAASGRWGMKRGLSVNVVHPNPARQATELVLHDRMQTASFTILGVTCRDGKPLVAEPGWDHLAYGTPTGTAATPGLWQPADGVIVSARTLQAVFDTSDGLRWSGPHAPGALACATGPVFEVTVGGRALPAADWTVEVTETIGAGRVFVLRNRAAGLGARVQCVAGAEDELALRCTLINEGDAPVTATLHFPVIRGLHWGQPGDTWYLCGKRGGIINWAPLACREPLGERHPMQVDGFFSPQRGLALACLTHDTVGHHHFRNFAKSAEGGQWSAEYVERDLAPGRSFEATEAALVLREGDWRAIFGAYADWLGTWFEPASPHKPWFERLFAVLATNVHYDAVPEPERRGQIQPLLDTMMKHIGICDFVHLFGWGASQQYGDWGDYDHYEEVGGKEYFRANIDRVQRAGIPVSLYLDAYLSSEKGQHAGAHAQEWAMKRADGSAQFVPVYDAYNECPYMEGWQDHLRETYARVQQDLGPRVMYIDEYGATDGRWICRAKDHGHNGYEIPYAGEVATLAKIREAVGPEVALYTEYPPAEVSRRYLDGSITYQALWSADQEGLAPHFIDLPRFAFPHFKQFHIIHYVTTRAGNWWLFKFPFFNGEVFRVGEPGLPGMDGPSLDFLRRALQVQCAHRDAFASETVEPLVPTEISGVFANLLAAPHENVWTLYNANGRSVRAPVLRARHAPGATYENAWTGEALGPEIRNGDAWLAVELGPKSVGCIVQKAP